MTNTDFSENTLVEQPAIALFGELGYATANCYHEKIGTSNSSLGRETPADVVLAPKLKAALKKLNPDVADDAIRLAVEELTKDRSAMSMVQANREIYKLLKEGVRVSFQDDEGSEANETLRVIDWIEPENNDFFLASQFWVTGSIYKRRGDLIGFVNGLPLIFIELKKTHSKVEHAYKNNLKDYKSTIPQLFWYNAIIILSNGSQAKIGSVTAGWEHFSDWKRINSEGEQGVISLETLIRGTCEKSRFLDLVENFTVFDDAKGGLDQDRRQEPSVPGREQLRGRLGANQREPGQAWRLLAYTGKRQKLFDGLLQPEGAAKSAGQLDIPGHHRPRRPGQPNLQELPQRRSRYRGVSGRQRRDI